MLIIFLESINLVILLLPFLFSILDLTRLNRYIRKKRIKIQIRS